MRIIKNIFEYILMVVLLILFAPLIICLIVFIAAPIFLYEWINNRLRHAPTPTVPNILNDEKYESDEIAKLYVQKIKESVEDVSVMYKKDLQTYTFTSSKLGERKVVISVDDYGCELSITDLNSYEWNTANNEAKNIDFFIWIAIGALRSGVTETRSRFGRRIYWVWCDEMNVWCLVQREGSSYDSVNFYEKNKAPDKVISTLLEDK